VTFYISALEILLLTYLLTAALSAERKQVCWRQTISCTTPGCGRLE